MAPGANGHPPGRLVRSLVAMEPERKDDSATLVFLSLLPTTVESDVVGQM